MAKVSPCRQVPFTLEKGVKKELDRMEGQEIIAKISEPTEFVHPVVVVLKKDKKSVRLCLDPQALNLAIMRQHYKLATFEENTAHMGNPTQFTVLDANKGFYQICLEEESSKLTTFITPFGRYKFLRLPFGVSSSPEVFYETFVRIFDGIEGCRIFVDDILVWGKSKEEHDKRLRQVLQRAREWGVRFNEEKCKFGVPEVTYVGHKLSCKVNQIRLKSKVY